MKNEHQATFHKKIQAKEGAKIKPFMLLLIQGCSLWCLTFFGRILLQFSQKILHSL